MADLTLRIPSDFGTPRDSVSGPGAGETFELTCVDCGRVVASGVWTAHTRDLGWALELHADECACASLRLRRWR